MLPPNSSAAGRNRAGCSHARRSGFTAVRHEMACHAERVIWDTPPNAVGCRRRRSWRARGRSSCVTWHVRCTRSRFGRRPRRRSVRPPPLSLACSPHFPPALTPAHVESYVVSHSACRLACCVQARTARLGSRCTRTHAHTLTDTQVLVDARWRGWAAQLKALAWVRHTPGRKQGVRFATPRRSAARRFPQPEVSAGARAAGAAAGLPRAEHQLCGGGQGRRRAIHGKPKAVTRGGAAPAICGADQGMRGARRSQCSARPDRGGHCRAFVQADSCRSGTDDGTSGRRRRRRRRRSCTSRSARSRRGLPTRTTPH